MIQPHQYRPLEAQTQHDAWGIGAVVNISGQKTHRAVEDALRIVEKLEHRTGKDADGTTFSIRVSPNRHLIMDLMARSDRLEVLSPKEVRDSIRNEVDKMKKIYGD